MRLFAATYHTVDRAVLRPRAREYAFLRSSFEKTMRRVIGLVHPCCRKPQGVAWLPMNTKRRFFVLCHVIGWGAQYVPFVGTPRGSNGASRWGGRSACGTRMARVLLGGKKAARVFCNGLPRESARLRSAWRKGERDSSLY